MIIEEIKENKENYMELLLIGDEQRDMIERYLYSGKLFVLEDEGTVGGFVLLKLADKDYELKNIAVYPQFEGKGYGRKMMEIIFESYRGTGITLLVGTGESPKTLGLYEHMGFVYSHRIKNFFTDNYDHEMVEDGVVLKDMIYLKKSFEYVK